MASRAGLRHFPRGTGHGAQTVRGLRSSTVASPCWRCGDNVGGLRPIRWGGGGAGSIS